MGFFFFNDEITNMKEGFVFDNGSWGILGSILGKKSKIKEADSALTLM